VLCPLYIKFFLTTITSALFTIYYIFFNNDNECFVLFILDYLWHLSKLPHTALIPDIYICSYAVSKYINCTVCCCSWGPYSRLSVQARSNRIYSVFSAQTDQRYVNFHVSRGGLAGLSCSMPKILTERLAARADCWKQIKNMTWTPYSGPCSFCLLPHIQI